MLPAILGIEIDGFGKVNDKVFYREFSEASLVEKTGIESFYEIKNAQDQVLVCEADPSVFKMYRVK